MRSIVLFAFLAAAVRVLGDNPMVSHRYLADPGVALDVAALAAASNAAQAFALNAGSTDAAMLVVLMPEPTPRKPAALVARLATCWSKSTTCSDNPCDGGSSIACGRNLGSAHLHAMLRRKRPDQRTRHRLGDVANGDHRSTVRRSVALVSRA